MQTQTHPFASNKLSIIMQSSPIEENDNGKKCKNASFYQQICRFIYRLSCIDNTNKNH